MVSEQATQPRRAFASEAVTWLVAAVGGAAAIFIYPGIPVGYLFSVVLVDQPPHGLASATSAALTFLVFAVLPVLAALLVGRAVRREASVAVSIAAALWTISLTSAVCFAAYLVVWPFLP
jgi:hypothetical protein